MSSTPTLHMTDESSYNADVVLRSSDGEQFKVHKTVLSAASPFFSTMFSLPQPPSTPQDELPVIDMPEAAHTLQSLLRFIYPTPDPDVDGFENITDLLITADKYEFDGVIATLRSSLISPRYLIEDPLRVYAITTQFDFTPENNIAARGTFRIKLENFNLPPDLYGMNPSALTRLERLRLRHTQNLQRLLIMPSLSSCASCNGYNAGVPASTVMYGPPRWWTTWKTRAKGELRERPISDVIFEDEFMGEVGRACGCKDCAQSMEGSVEGMEELRRTLDELPLEDVDERCWAVR